MKIFNLLFYPAHTASSTLRTVIPFKAMAKRFGAEIVTADPLGISPELVRSGVEADLYVLNREVPCWVCELLIQKANCEGRKVIYELDDYILNAPGVHPHKRVYDDYRSRIEQVLSDVDMVVVSTEALAARIRKLNSRVHVYRNMLPIDVRPSTISGEPPIVIGYTGLAAHSRELEFILHVFRALSARLGDRVRFKVIGLDGCGLPRDVPIEQIPATPNYDAYRKNLASAGFDIGLGYLAPDEFNDCKSLIKFLEYSANGTIGVFSDRGAYTELASEGVCLLLADDPDAWIEKIVDIVERISWYRAIGTAGFVFAEGEGDESGAIEYYRALEKLLAEPRRSPWLKSPGEISPREAGIFGAGATGRYCAVLLEALGVKITSFFETEVSAARQVYGIPVLPIDELARNPGLSVLIASYTHYDEMKSVLESCGRTHRMGIL